MLITHRLLHAGYWMRADRLSLSPYCIHPIPRTRLAPTHLPVQGDVAHWNPTLVPRGSRVVKGGPFPVGLRRSPSSSICSPIPPWPGPCTRSKSLVGSAAFVIGGFSSSVFFVALFHACGFTTLTPAGAVPALLLVSLASAAVELLPAELADDNLSVPIFAWAMCALLFGSA